MQVAGKPLPRSHARRLREVWRSAGWPCCDMVEVELLAAGLLQRRLDAQGRETLRVTDAGVQALAGALQGNRGARDAHEALVRQVALAMQRDGRLVWLGLSLRAALSGPAAPAAQASPTAQASPAAPASPASQAAPVAPVDASPSPTTRWAMAMPDVFSIRHTTREDWVEPVVHEIKVRRADLLSDLRKPDKRDAYLALSSRCWYVLAEGIGEPEEIPADFGVLIAHPGRLEVARPAPARPHKPGLATWMALAKADILAPPEDEPQGLL
jgi:hypothetical protein